MYQLLLLFEMAAHDPENLEKVQLCAARIVDNEKTHPKSPPPPLSHGIGIDAWWIKFF